jgi:polygalacturonase
LSGLKAQHFKISRVKLLEVRSIFAAFCLCSFAPAAVGADSCFNARDYGAVGDGSALDSPAINRAIEAAAGQGGGTVFLPAGTYLCGSIRLRSHITLHLDHGASLRAAPPESKAFDVDPPLPYPAYQDFGHSTWRNALIWGENLEHIAITGHGRIDGAGNLRSGARPGGGAKAIALKLCRNITLRDFTILRGGHFGVLPTGCDNLRIDGLLVDSNRDGINLDCCRNVTVANSIINSDDDGLCLKSSYALGYARATENVTVVNCVFSAYAVGSVADGSFKDEGPCFGKEGGTITGLGDNKRGAIKRISGLKFGTESNGGFKNIAIANCIFDKCWMLALESVDGGDIENVRISNIIMRDLPGAPIFIRLGHRARGPEGTGVGRVRNISINGLTATVRGNRYGGIISGIPGHPIENLTLRDVDITVAGGGTVADSRRVVPENERGGPAPTMFGDMPSYGLFIRHVAGLRLENVRLRFEKPDQRPAIVLCDVERLQLCDVDAQRAQGGRPSIVKTKGARLTPRKG